MSKAKHPGNMALLTASEHFVLKFAHICPTITSIAFYRILTGQRRVTIFSLSKSYLEVNPPPRNYFWGGMCT